MTDPAGNNDVAITTMYQTGYHWAILVPAAITLVIGLSMVIMFGGMSYDYSQGVAVLINDLARTPQLIIGIVGWPILLTGGVAMGLQLVKYQTTRITVTDYSVQWEAGLIGKLQDEIENRRIESVQPDQTILGRIFGWVGLGSYGSVLIRGVGRASVAFNAIPDHYAFRDAVQRQIR